MSAPLTEETGLLILAELRKLNAKKQSLPIKATQSIEQHYSAEAVANRLSCDPSTVRKLIVASKLTAVKVGKRFCIPESAIKSYLDNRTLHAAKSKKSSLAT